MPGRKRANLRELVEVLGAAYFREVAAVVDAAAGGPPDVTAIGDVMRRHGLTPAP